MTLNELDAHAAAILAWLENGGQDRAMLAAFLSRNKALVGRFAEIIEEREASKPPEPIPAKAAISALEAAVFDNWIPYGGKRPKKGAKGHSKRRHVITAKVWTCAPDKIDFNRQSQPARYEIPLLDREGLTAKAEEMAAKEPEFAKALTEVAANMDGDFLAGPVSSKAKGFGTHLHPGQIFVAQLGGADPFLRFINLTTGESIDLPLGKLDAGGNALRGNVALQARWSADDALKSYWTTN